MTFTGNIYSNSKNHAETLYLPATTVTTHHQEETVEFLKIVGGGASFKRHRGSSEILCTGGPGFQK